MGKYGWVLMLYPYLFVGLLSGGATLLAQDDSSGQSASERSLEQMDQLVKSYIRGQQTFSFRLYAQLHQKSGNLMFSPYSVSTLLSMSYAGADGNTAREIRDALSYPKTSEVTTAAISTLNTRLKQIGSEQPSKDTLTFQTANALWHDHTLSMKDAFQKKIAESFGRPVQSANFQESPEVTRRDINHWVKKETRGKITRLLPEGTITSSTKLVFTNAIYFQGKWKHPFREINTERQTFMLQNEESVNVPMMTQTETFRYGDRPDYKMVSIPYRGERFSMVVLLPDRGQFSKVESSLSSEGILDTKQLQQTSVKLTLPKFRFSSPHQLVAPLERLGMKSAFTRGANFSGMTPGKHGEGLSISNVIHKTFVEVDEQGTEAAAASGGIMRSVRGSGHSAEFIADRPFLFFIVDRKTELLLFMGRVMNPAKS